MNVAVIEMCPPDPRDPLAWLENRPEIDILAGSDPAPFIEETRVTKESMRGSAPPRRRPRRVAKKLAARGYRAHFNTPGKARPREVFWQHTARAPRLRAKLEYCSPFEVTLIRVPDRQLQHDPPPDRRRFVYGLPRDFYIAPPEPPPLVPVDPRRVADARHNGRYRVERFRAPDLDLQSVLARGDGPIIVDDDSEFWIARDLGCERQIFARRFGFALRLHAPEDRFDAHQEVAVKRFEVAAYEFCRAVMSAAYGTIVRGRLVARQTSYRPIKKRKPAGRKAWRL